MAKPVYYEGQEFENPNDPTAPVLVYRAGKFIPKREGGGVRGGFDAAIDAPEYQKKVATARAVSDLKRLDGISSLEAEAYGNEATAGRAADVISGDTPSGFAPGFRMGLGKVLGGTPLARLPGIPTTEQTANLETLEQLGNTGALGQVGQLKGPLSDKDIAFIKSLQYSPASTKMQNKRVVEAHQWLARRQAAYAAALRKWTEKLGSPSALNPAGESFDRWWGGYSAREMPAPAITRPRAAGAPKASPAANAPRVAKDPYPGISEGQVVQQGGVSYRRRGNEMVPVS